MQNAIEMYVNHHISNEFIMDHDLWSTFFIHELPRGYNFNRG